MLNCPAAPCSWLYACSHRYYRHFGFANLLIIQLALTINFLPFSCSGFHAYITWCSIQIWKTGAQSITSCLITGNDRCPHSTLTGASPLKMWHMDKLTDVPNRKFTTWERHWGPSVAVCGSSPSALLILHQKRLRHTPLPHLRSASPAFIIQLPPHSAFMTHWAKLMLRDSPGRA